MAAGGPPVYTLSPAAARALLVRQQSVPIAKPQAHLSAYCAQIRLVAGPLFFAEVNNRLVNVKLQLC
jgi:hypothetical protein